jgi:hypothetical protein
VPRNDKKKRARLTPRCEFSSYLIPTNKKAAGVLPEAFLLVVRNFSELFLVFDKRPTFYSSIFVATKEAKALSAVSCSQLNRSVL